LITSAKRPSKFIFISCPFCETTLEDIEKQFESQHIDLTPSEELQKHIGQHLQKISIFALLEPDETNGSIDSDTSKRQGSRSTLQSSCLEIGFSEVNVEDSYVQANVDDVPELDKEVSWDRPILVPPENDPILAEFAKALRTEIIAVPVESMHLVHPDYLLTD
jgi:hypothetical protein